MDGNDRQMTWDELAKENADLRKSLEEANTVLSAWHEVFGTTQLTHALSRLEEAEKKAKSLEEKEAEIEQLSIKLSWVPIEKNELVKAKEEELSTLRTQRDGLGEAMERIGVFGVVHYKDGFLVQETLDELRKIAKEALAKFYKKEG